MVLLQVCEFDLQSFLIQSQDDYFQRLVFLKKYLKNLNEQF